MVGLHEDRTLLTRLERADYRARVERGLLISVEAFDWNCPQHITPRFSAAEVDEKLTALRDRIGELETELAGLRATAG